MILFEFGLSSDDVQRVRNCDGGKELHAAGLFATIFNHLVFGPITYYLTVKYGFIQQHDRAFWQQLYSIVMFLLIENGLYWVAHYLMHTRRLYWMHRLESYPRLNVGHGSYEQGITLHTECAYLETFYSLLILIPQVRAEMRNTNTNVPLLTLVV